MNIKNKRRLKVGALSMATRRNFVKIQVAQKSWPVFVQNDESALSRKIYLAIHHKI
jgi:hypothetical protein